MKITTPVILDGYVQWVPIWRANQGAAAYLYGEDFNSPYSPVEFEVSHNPRLSKATRFFCLDYSGRKTHLIKMLRRIH